MTPTACPFCGGRAEARPNLTRLNMGKPPWRCGCADTFCRGSWFHTDLYFDTCDGAVANWNRRRHGGC